eukprot:gene11845-2385_t
MPTLCCIVSCGNKQRKGNDIRFFRIPAIIKNKGDRAQELSERRRGLWIAAINREDASWKKVDGWRVCSKHFISGCPSLLFDDINPDWVPSLQLGYGKERNSSSDQSDCDRYERVIKRKAAFSKSEEASGSPSNFSRMEHEGTLLLSEDENNGTEEDASNLKRIVEVERNEAAKLQQENFELREELNKLTKANERLLSYDECYLYHEDETIYEKCNSSDFEKENNVPYEKDQESVCKICLDISIEIYQEPQLCTTGLSTSFSIYKYSGVSPMMSDPLCGQRS